MSLTRIVPNLTEELEFGIAGCTAAGSIARKLRSNPDRHLRSPADNLLGLGSMIVGRRIRRRHILAGVDNRPVHSG